jgi:ATP-dependent RNA helicase SUPV3L1/SUV3
MKRRFVLHLGETNTGKTYQALERLKQAKKGVYLAPLRILALENYEKLNREGVPCHLLTGEEEILIQNAEHISSTIEKLDRSRVYDVAVIDEIQMIANSQRGQAWTRAVLSLQCEEIHICGAINAKDLMVSLLSDCGDSYEIREYVRQTPLELFPEPFSLKDAMKGDALVTFSKRQVLELSKYFQDRGVKTSVIYGDLPPEVRRMQYQAFIGGESRILITTDAIGMGVNLPIRRIIFMTLQKFDGEEVRYITSQEVKQIGGRAGRKGIYDIGYVGVAGIEQQFIIENLETEDEPLTQAVLGPSEAILRIGGLPLKEKLALWSTSRDKLTFYRKMDVRDYLLILETIKSYKLPEQIEYQLMKLPFDVNDTELLNCFLSFVEEYFMKKTGTVTKPDFGGRLLFEQEKYYQKLNLYYSFLKNFKVGFDPNWVYSEREKTSARINKLLLKL